MKSRAALDFNRASIDTVSWCPSKATAYQILHKTDKNAVEFVKVNCGRSVRETHHDSPIPPATIESRVVRISSAISIVNASLLLRKIPIIRRKKK